MMRRMRRRRPRSDAETAAVEKDFFLNLLMVLLFLIGGGSLMTGARTPGTGEPEIPNEAVRVYVEDNGALRLGSRSSSRLSVEELQRALRELDGSAPILVHHGEATPAGFVHAALRAVGSVREARAFLVLDRHENGEE